MRKTIDLQLFADAVRGKKIVYLYRLKKDAAKNAATALAFTTENGRTTSKDADTTETKDGTIRTPGAAEVEITATSILAKGDTLIDSLEDAMINDELVEIWEANLDEPASSGSNKFKGKYFQGYVTELEKTSNAEDMVEVSLTFGVNGTGEKGDVTVTAAQQEVAAYVFTDTTKTGRRYISVRQYDLFPERSGQMEPVSFRKRKWYGTYRPVVHLRYYQQVRTLQQGSFKAEKDLRCGCFL